MAPWGRGGGNPGHSGARDPGHSGARDPGHSGARDPGHSGARDPGYGHSGKCAGGYRRLAHVVWEKGGQGLHTCHPCIRIYTYSLPACGLSGAGCPAPDPCAAGAGDIQGMRGDQPCNRLRRRAGALRRGVDTAVVALAHPRALAARAKQVNACSASCNHNHHDRHHPPITVPT
eukprot:366267-Chlamydomonas_euryale.AAC.3